MPVARYEVEELRRLARRQGDGPFQPLGLGKKISNQWIFLVPLKGGIGFI